MRFFWIYSSFDLFEIDIHGNVTDKSLDWQTDEWIDRLIEVREFI